MQRSLPAHLRRIHCRLLQRDSAGLVERRLDRATQHDLLDWLAAAASNKGPGLEDHAPVMAGFLHHLSRSIREDASRGTSRSRAVMFGAGMIAGCHLRDAAEHDSPTSCRIAFDSALRQLDSTCCLSSLWMAGLPLEIDLTCALAQSLFELAPRGTSCLNFHVRHLLREPEVGRTRSDQLQFLAGFLAAGIAPPPRTSDKRKALDSPL